MSSNWNHVSFVHRIILQYNSFQIYWFRIFRKYFINFLNGKWRRHKTIIIIIFHFHCLFEHDRARLNKSIKFIMQIDNPKSKWENVVFNAFSTHSIFYYIFIHWFINFQRAKPFGCVGCHGSFNLSVIWRQPNWLDIHNFHHFINILICILTMWQADIWWMMSYNM